MINHVTIEDQLFGFRQTLLRLICKSSLNRKNLIKILIRPEGGYFSLLTWKIIVKALREHCFGLFRVTLL